MKRFFVRGAHAAFGLWIGAVACVSFVVAPTVFRVLDDNELAGEVMAPIFRSVDLFGVAAAALFAVAAKGRKWRSLLAAVLGAIALVNAALVAPKAGAEDLYHRISVGLWGAILVAGIALLLIGPRPSERR